MEVEYQLGFVGEEFQSVKGRDGQRQSEPAPGYWGEGVVVVEKRLEDVVVVHVLVHGSCSWF